MRTGVGMLNGKAVAVVAADDAAGRELEAGLAGLGATTHALDDRPVDGVVVAPFSRSDASALVDVAEPVWEASCDDVIKAALGASQAAFAALQGRGGRLVFVVPIEGMTGSAGRVALATAGEAIRSLAKSAARAWGRDGVTANCVAVPLAVLFAGTGTPPPAGWALGRAPSWTDVSSAVAMFLTDASGFVTGTTVCVDGGDVMTP